MENKQEGNVNEVAEKFAEAVQASVRNESYGPLEGKGCGFELTQDFFGTVIKEIQGQGYGDQATAQEMIGQSSEQQEAVLQISQDSVDTAKACSNPTFAV